MVMLAPVAGRVLLEVWDLVVLPGREERARLLLSSCSNRIDLLRAPAACLVPHRALLRVEDLGLLSRRMLGVWPTLMGRRWVRDPLPLRRWAFLRGRVMVIV